MADAVELIKEFCASNMDAYEIYLRYSGRFMFGRECIGIVVRNGYSYMDMIVKLTRFFDDNNYTDPEFLLEGLAVDELGLDTVVYFPRLNVES